MTTPGPDRLPPGWLAAYADGELDAAGRAAVERWLAEHPGALDDLAAQRELSPANAALWERAEPPEPSAAAWAAVRDGIAGQVHPVAASARWRWLLAGLAASGVAAAVAWLAFGPAVPRQPVPDSKPAEVVKVPATPEVAPPPRPVKPGPLEEFAVLAVAEESDVELERVPGCAAGCLPVGRHPLSDSLELAGEEDVRLEGVVPSPVWPAGGPRMTTAPGDAPMIYAARIR